MSAVKDLSAHVVDRLTRMAWPGLAESSRRQCLADGPEKLLLANRFQKNPGANAMRGLRSLDEFLSAGDQDNG